MIHRLLATIAASDEPVHFVGSQKNSGKTTTLLRVYQELLEQKVPALLCSTGIDGEAGDHFFGHEKPRIRVEPGTFVLTRKDALQDSRARLLAVFPEVGDGLFGLFEILSFGTVELWGPPSARDLHEALKTAREILSGPVRASPVSTPVILVDGALDRQAIVARGDARMILCMAAGAFSGFQAACNWLRFATARYTLPLWEPEDGVEPVMIEGPLTNQMARELEEREQNRNGQHDSIKVVVSSPMHLFLDEGIFYRMAHRLRVRQRPNWIGLSVYPGGRGTEVDKKRFMEEAQRVVGNRPVFDPLALSTMREG